MKQQEVPRHVVRKHLANDAAYWFDGEIPAICLIWPDRLGVEPMQQQPNLKKDQARGPQKPFEAAVPTPGIARLSLAARKDGLRGFPDAGHHRRACGPLLASRLTIARQHQDGLDAGCHTGFLFRWFDRPP